MPKETKKKNFFFVVLNIYVTYQKGKTMFVCRLLNWSFVVNNTNGCEDI